jgi:hypothetical protein
VTRQLGRVDPEKPHALIAAPQGVSVDDLGTGTLKALAASGSAEMRLASEMREDADQHGERDQVQVPMT